MRDRQKRGRPRESGCLDRRESTPLAASVPIGNFSADRVIILMATSSSNSEGVQSLDGPRFRRITINGEQVPTDFLNWKYRYRPLREYLVDQGNTYEIGTMEIRDGKVILRSRIG